jgi:alpha 1,2-mannosyltransferase
VNKSAIVYMTRLQDLWLLRHSLKFLFENFNKEAKYPVVIFHDDLNAEAVKSLADATKQDLGYIPDNIEFVALQFETPASVSTDPHWYDPPLTQFRLGYRHMCRFFGGLIFNHPALSGYKYCWRLDSDSFILSSVTNDPFKQMESAGYKYAFLDRVDYDEAFACRGLWDTTKDFMNANKGILKNEVKSWNMEVYYTNFEIYDMDFFRGAEYQSYFKYLDSTNNIYYRRWGDHCIRFLGLSMFADPSDIWCIKDFSYQHGSWIGNPSKMNPSVISTIPEPFRSMAARSMS